MHNKTTNLKVGIWFFSSLAAILLVSFLANIVILNSSNRILASKIVEAKELARPANLKLTILKASDCDDCFDVSPILEAVKKANVNIESELWLEKDDAKSKDLIKKYSIDKLPSFIVEGELQKDSQLNATWPSLGNIEENTFVFRKTRPPFIAVKSGEVKGRLEITLVADRACENCYDVTGHERIIHSMGMPTQNSKVVEINQTEGREVLKKYNIKLIPTVIISGDMEAYPEFKKIWPQVGTIERDGAYVMKDGVKRMGIYKDLSTGKIIDPRQEANLEASKDK